MIRNGLNRNSIKKKNNKNKKYYSEKFEAGEYEFKKKKKVLAKCFSRSYVQSYERVPEPETIKLIVVRDLRHLNICVFFLLLKCVYSIKKSQIEAMVSNLKFERAYSLRFCGKLLLFLDTEPFFKKKFCILV